METKVCDVCRGRGMIDRKRKPPARCMACEGGRVALTDYDRLTKVAPELLEFVGRWRAVISFEGSEPWAKKFGAEADALIAKAEGRDR